MKNNIISIHTPKTGGLSLLEMFKIVYGEESVSNPNFFGINIIDGVGELGEIGECSYKVTHGHFKLGITFKKTDELIVTFLREPISNLFSLYTMIVSGYSPKDAPSKKFTYWDFIQIPSIRYLYTKTFFGGVPIGLFDFIGDFSKWASEVDRLSGVLGVTLPGDIHIHKTTDIPNCPAAFQKNYPEMLSKINTKFSRSILKEDIDFYNTYAGL